MTAQVLAFKDVDAADEREALIAALTPLHTLITLDPTLGASSVRVYFVLNPDARSRIVAAVDPAERGRARSAPALALVAYDFPFALHLVQTTAPQIAEDEAKRIVLRSAGLQGDALAAAADAFDLDAQTITGFDAEALKAMFFPSTQETVAHLLRLSPRGR